MGLFVGGSDATLEVMVIERTLPRPLDQQAGWGVGVRDNPRTGQRARLDMWASTVRSHSDVGLHVYRSDAQLFGVMVRQVASEPPDHTGGFGVYIYNEVADGRGSTATLEGCLVQDVESAGVVVFGSQASIDGVSVKNVALSPVGGFADGVVVVGGAATVTGSRIESAARAGLRGLARP